jgi:translocation and assembly module TamB
LIAPREQSEARIAAGRTRRWLLALLLFAIVVIGLVAGGGYWLSTQSALDALLARAVARSQGRLSVEGATGSLLSTVKIERLRWEGDEVTLEASGVALTWSPTDLLSRRFHAQGFAAQTLAVTLRPSAGPTVLPTSLALPLAVSIAHAGIGRIDWRSGERHGSVTALAFAYAGDATRHQLDDIELVTESGTLSGALSVGANAPFALAGRVTFRGDGDMRDAAADGSVKGTLEAFDVDAKVALRGAGGSAVARIAPFSAVPVESAKLTLADVDLRRFAPALPATRLGVKLDAAPGGGGFAGTIEASNSDGGPVDAGRIPVSALTARFTWTADSVDVSDLAATLTGRGSVSGSARYDLAREGARVDLRLNAVDLRRIHSALVTTALNGTLSGDLAGSRQTLRGDLSQSNLRFAFEASIEQRIVQITSFRGNAGVSEIAASGRVALDGARAFSVDGTARRFDPARFASVPAGSLNASFKASGALAPAWSASVEASVAQGSELAGVAVSGIVRGDFDAQQWRNAQAKLRVADGDLTASGNAGRSGDKLVFGLDIPELRKLRPLLAATATYATYKVPEQVSGALRASGSLSVQPAGSGFDVDAHVQKLVWGTAWSVAAIDAHATLPPAPAMQNASDTRSVALVASASDLHTPQGAFAAARIDVSGAAAHHAIDVSLRGEGFDVHAALSGALGGVMSGAGAAPPSRSAWVWSGSVDALENKGDYAVALNAPARLDVSSEHVRLSDAHVRVADGVADIDEFVWDAGRITSSGNFSRVPVAAVARMAGRPLPMRSTLTLKGDWSVAAAPRLDGTINVARDGGDIYATDANIVDPVRALGISVLEVSARFAGDAVSARGELRSVRAGNADATVTLGTSPSAPPGRIAGDAPLTAKLVADLASLRPLQVWLGTLAAIDGRARLDIAAGGTLANPVLSGEVSADDVRIALPQYGVQLTDGRLRSHLAGDRVLLDEFSLSAGDGSFTAHGTLAATPKSGVIPDVTWHAERFRILNRPDLRMVIGGDGTLAVASGKLVLAGKVHIDEGQIVYEAVASGRLADDVVVVGRPARPPSDSSASIGDTPLRLDLEVSTESGVTFSGEGLDARLAGSVHLTTQDNGELNARGTIRTSYGTYTALGQKLTIDRGALIFDGPVDNPALDVVALRKNLAVEAGLEVTGTVRVPRVRLVSNPPVPDNEKLSWLVSGQPLDSASRTDISALATASAALLGKGQRPVTQTLANSVGLDDISVHGSTVVRATGQTSGQVVAFGRRISERLTLVYEQGLTIATNALRIEYALTKTITLRAEAGTVGSFGVYYRRNFE